MCAEKLRTLPPPAGSEERDEDEEVDVDGAEGAGATLKKLRSNPTESSSRRSATSPRGSVGSKASENAALLPAVPSMMVAIGMLMESVPPFPAPRRHPGALLNGVVRSGLSHGFGAFQSEKHDAGDTPLFWTHPFVHVVNSSALAANPLSN